MFCWVHHHQREDAVTLYGFATKDERMCFEALIGAHGVGPALALAILSIHSPLALARILADDDSARCAWCPASARRRPRACSIELKSRLSMPDLGQAPARHRRVGHRRRSGRRSRADVRDALVGARLQHGEVRDVMADLPADGEPARLLRDALQRLGAARR